MTLSRREGPADNNRPKPSLPQYADTNGCAALEAALGRQAYAELIYQAGYKSARYWCEMDTTSHGLTGEALFGHCLERLSRSGWGRFELINLDLARNRADVRLEPSTFVLAQAETCEATKVCYMLSGWLDGVMGGVGERMKDADGQVRKTRCRESQCATEGHRHCIFSVRPEPSPDRAP